ncbi:sensor histidine kinase [Actinomadura yumaensis]|uniref:Oxygen sensor histidine kinase NreB n=1 Tax=Actinomadura yumaensis TaxID=111807 RepID=A0ABW2CZM0_9ACTN
MKRRPRPDDRYQARNLRAWYGAVWTVFGLCPPMIAVHDRSDATLYRMAALTAVLALAYAVGGRSPAASPPRRYAFLAVLVLALGGSSLLLNGGAAMLVLSLPHFWLLAGGPRRAIALSGAAAAATLTGGLVREGWAAGLLTGNAAFTLIGYAASVLLGLGAHRLIAQRDERERRLSAELETAQRRLAEAHRRQGAADERDRIAREIHDTLAQGFASIVVLAEAARSGIAADPDRSARQLLSIERTARENLTEARALIASGPPPVPSSANGSPPHPGSGPPDGAAPASVARTLRRTLDRFAEDTGIAVSADLPDVECDQPTRIALLRCTQESLANVRKHAAAATVGVVLARAPHGVELEITDDGRGFAAGAPRGFGLDGMRRRLSELGGELTVTSAPGEGTRVLAVIPTNEQE